MTLMTNARGDSVRGGLTDLFEMMLIHNDS